LLNRKTEALLESSADTPQLDFIQPTANPIPELQAGEEAQIWAEYDRLVAHPNLGTSPNLVKILRFLLTCTLSGDTEQLKEYTIAVSALRRREDFDPRTDSIIRTQIGKLRSKLHSIYQETGTPNGIRLGLQKGNYRMQIELCERNTADLKEANTVSFPPAVLKALAEVPVLLVAVPNWIVHPEASSAGLRVLAQELVSRLAESGAIRVFQSSLPVDGSSMMQGIDHETGMLAEVYILDFLPIPAAANGGLSVRLLHATSREVLLSVEVASNAATNLASYQELLANRILARMRHGKVGSGTELVADSIGLRAAQLVQKGWFHLQQLSGRGAVQARSLFQEAARGQRFDRETNTGRVLSAVVAAFACNYAATDLKTSAQLGLLDYGIGCPELVTEREALAQIIDATFKWRWPSNESVLAVAEQIDTRSWIAPVFALLVLLPLEHVDSAISLLEKASRQCLTNPVIFAALGWAQLAANRTAAADDAFREALELEPRCLLAQEGLSRLSSGKAISGLPAQSSYSDLESAFNRAKAGLGDNCSFSTLQLLGVAIRQGEVRTLMVPFDPAFAAFRLSPHYAAFRSTMREQAALSPSCP